MAVLGSGMTWKVYVAVPVCRPSVRWVPEISMETS